MLKVHVTNAQKQLPVAKRWLTQLARLAALPEWQDAELSIAVVDGLRMAELNERYTGRANDTDVLAFPLDDDADDGLVGEVIVSATRAAEEAAARGIAAKDELSLYVVHGVLHLGGHDDHDPKARRKMYAREREVLRVAGLGDVRRASRAR